MKLDNVTRLCWDNGVGCDDRRCLSESLELLLVQVNPAVADGRFPGVSFATNVGALDPQNDLNESFHLLRRVSLGLAWVVEGSFAGRTRVFCCRGDKSL